MWLPRPWINRRIKGRNRGGQYDDNPCLGPEESKGLSDMDRERVLKAWMNAFSGETYRVYCQVYKWVCSLEGVFSVNYFCRFRQLFLPVHPPFLTALLGHSGAVAGDVEF